MEIVPSMITANSNRQQGITRNSSVEVNHQVHFPISSGFSWNALDVNFSLRNRRIFCGYNSVCLETHPTPAHGSVNIDKSKFGSSIHFPSRSQINYADAPSKTSQFSSNNCFVHVPAKASTQQAFGSSSLQQVGQTSVHVARNTHKVKYACRECDKVFPSYLALEGI